VLQGLAPPRLTDLREVQTLESLQRLRAHLVVMHGH